MAGKGVYDGVYLIKNGNMVTGGLAIGLGAVGLGSEFAALRHIGKINSINTSNGVAKSTSGSHNVRTGAGRDHVAYEGIKNGKPYSGYASAPEGKFQTPEEIINYRYKGNFDDFGGVQPKPILGSYGNGITGKAKARGAEQATFQNYVNKFGKENVANKRNPFGPNNPLKEEYMNSVGVKYEHQ